MIAVVVASNQDENWLPWSAFYAVTALAFVPAIVVSAIGSPRREAVLRAAAALCIVLGFASFVVLDPGLFLLLSPPTVFLATGAGLIWSRKKAT